MPQPAFHLQVCNNCIDAWTERSGDAPFDPHDPANRAAFLHGALGPDMGFFPGADPWLSRVAHRSPTGDLVRALAEQARGAREYAYVCGWASHVLLDAMVHPVINERAASLLGLSLESAALAELEHTHIRLEIGLDLAVHRRQPQLAKLRLPQLFDERGARFLARSLASVHGVSIAVETIAAAHRRVGQIMGPMLGLQSSMAFARVDGAAGVENAAVWSVRAGLGTLQAVAIRVRGADSKTAAFLTPLQVDASLLSSIDAAVARFHTEFQEYMDSGLSLLPNYNIDSGQIELAPYGESAA